MNKFIRKTLSIITVSLVVVIALYVSLSIYITHKIEDGLGNLPLHIQLDYKQIEIDLLSASAELDSVSLQLNSPDLSTKLLSATLKTIKIEGVSYRDLIYNRKLSINDLKMNSPKVVQYNSKLKKIKPDSLNKSDESKKPVKIYLEQLSLTNGSFKKYDSLHNIKTSAKSLNIFFNKINYNAKDNKKSIPFNFKSFRIEGESLMAQTSEFEILNVENFKITDKLFQLNNGTFQTKYSRRELNNHISKERDHFLIAFSAINARKYVLKGLDSNAISLKIPEIRLEKVDATIYRNKLKADDLTHKKLYSEQLRHLKHQLAIDSILISDSKITYAEKVKVGAQPGEIYFKNLNATIANLGNNYPKEKAIEIKVNTTFMKSTQLKVDWSFNVNDKNDRFLFKAGFGALPAEDLNPFVTPNLSIGLEGVLEETYFTIGGDKWRSAIDFKTRYENFKVDLLDRETKKEKKFLSSILNLFIAKDSKENTDNFRYARVTEVERDPTKSIFNFIWLNARSGLLKSMAGNGEKK